MNHHSRKPALLILLVAAMLGVAYVAAWGRVEQYFKNKGGDGSIESFEKKIAAGDKSPDTWFAYGEALMKAKQHGKAVAAFKEILRTNPMRQARFQCAMAMAAAGMENELYSFVNEIVYSTDAKVAEDILQRPELAQYMKSDRFRTLAAEAHSQAMD